MASLARFKANVNRVNEGNWVDLEDYGNIGIKTRGLTNAYQDARQARMRRAALKYSGDQTKLTQAEVRDIVAELLVQYCLLDVRNLQDLDGNEVPFETFKELIGEDAYQDLYVACIVAATRVSNEREADLEDAKKKAD
jgi:hypothetical protein